MKLNLCILLMLIFLITPVLGATTLSGVKLMGNYTAGQTITFPMTLSTASSDNPITYQITIMDFKNTIDGSYLASEPTNNPHSASPYIALDHSEMTIAPGESKTITAVIKIPESATGGLYSLINIHPIVTGSTGTTITTAMNVPIMITVSNTDLQKTGEITDLIINPSDTIITTFTNTGNTHYYNVKNIIKVGTSEKEESFSTEPLITAIIPGGTVIFTQHLNTSLSGTINSYVVSEDGTTLGVNSIIVVTPIETQIPIAIQTPEKLETVTPVPTPTAPVGIEISIISLISVIFLAKQKYI
jgi:hypothetical protein